MQFAARSFGRNTARVRLLLPPIGQSRVNRLPPYAVVRRSAQRNDANNQGRCEYCRKRGWLPRIAEEARGAGQRNEHTSPGQFQKPGYSQDVAEEKEVGHDNEHDDRRPSIDWPQPGGRGGKEQQHDRVEPREAKARCEFSWQMRATHRLGHHRIRERSPRMSTASVNSKVAVEELSQLLGLNLSSSVAAGSRHCWR